MNKKQFALSAAAFIVALALVSCEPLQGCAIEIGYEEQAGIDDYLSAYGANQHAIEIDYRVDEDGNRDAHVAILALQRVALNEQTKIYDNMNFSVAPSTVNVSGSGTYGYYKTSLDNKTHFGTWSLGSQNLFLSDSINLIIDTTNSGYTVSNMRFNSYVTLTNVLVFNILPPSGNYGRFSIYDASGYMGRSSATTGRDYYLASLNVNNAVPTIPAGVSIDVFSAYGAMTKGSPMLSLPVDDVDTSRPWDYYNNVLLPYIENNYGDIIDYQDFLVFPDGYQPPAQPTTVPVVRPTLPGFDFALETNGTEPPTDVNYNIPDMPGKDISVPAFDLTQINPREVMAPVAGGLRGIWELVGNVLTEYNLFPYVGIAVFAAIVFTLMRLGK